MATLRPDRGHQVFRALLRLLPFEFRSDHGRDMEQVFRDQRREAASEGRMKLTALWLRTAGGIARTAPSEHLATLSQDVWYGVRLAGRHRGFTIVALVTLSLGIGLGTTAYSVIASTLLRPLPFVSGDRLVEVNENNPRTGEERFEVSYPALLDLQAAAKTIESLSALTTTEASLRGGGEPMRVGLASVSPELFNALHVVVARGRSFEASDNLPTSRPVAILSQGLWQRRFGGSVNAIGETIDVDGSHATIVGITPSGFELPSTDVDLFMPIGLLTGDAIFRDRRVHLTTVIGRLAPGVSVETADAEIASLMANIQRQSPGADPGHTASVRLLSEGLVGPVRPALLVLAAAVAIVLVLACVNTAALLLARGLARQKETAIRTTLGATRFRLVRQLLTESLVLSGVAGILGTATAVWAVGSMRGWVEPLLPRAGAIAVDRGALLFAIVASIFTGLLFGIVPALRSSRADPLQDMKDGTPASQTRTTTRLRGALVVVQIALSLVLLAGAGLLVRSFWKLQHVTLGFRPESLLIMRIVLPDERYTSAASVIEFYRGLPATLKRLPGVEEVSAANRLPISGGDGHGIITVDGKAFAPGEAPGASYRRVLPNYFRAIGTPLLRGREFDTRDRGQDPKVVIVNDTMARRLWPGQDPIGQRIKVGPADREPWLTVVGVVGDVRNVGVAASADLDTYEPHAQRPWSTMALLVRVHGDTAQVTADVKSALKRLEPDLIVDRVQTMDSRLRASLASRRVNMFLLCAFAVFAAGLAGVAIYGLMAYTVSVRAREFGIRMALGAARADVILRVLSGAVRLALLGVTLGLGAAVFATRGLTTLLFEVSPGDLRTFAAVSAGVTLVTLAAAALPAWRATRVDPVRSLRAE
jgi:putative ABC transport system permease protein